MAVHSCARWLKNSVVYPENKNNIKKICTISMDILTKPLANN